MVDIVGLDRQADGGTHVNSTSEVGDMVVDALGDETGKMEAGSD